VVAAVAGCVIAAATALGLSALLESSVVTDLIVKYAGAAYLVYMAVLRLMSRNSTVDEIQMRRSASAARIFAGGFAIALLNPKTALFFLAFYRSS
jgi:threonine/homoserine/homoserine lactone efflux protein